MIKSCVLNVAVTSFCNSFTDQQTVKLKSESSPVSCHQYPSTEMCLYWWNGQMPFRWSAVLCTFNLSSESPSVYVWKYWVMLNAWQWHKHSYVHWHKCFILRDELRIWRLLKVIQCVLLLFGWIILRNELSDLQILSVIQEMYREKL